MLINHEHQPAAASRGRRRRFADLRQAARAWTTTTRTSQRSDRQGRADDRPAAAGRHQGQARAGLGSPGHRGVLQDLHPRRLPDQPVRAADAPRAVPVPPVDVRPVRRWPGDLRPGRPRAAAAADQRRTTRATSKRSATSRSPSARASGSADEHLDTPPTTPPRGGARPPPASGSPTGPTAGWASTAWPRPTCARSSRTTGPSCSGEICLYSFIILILTGVYLTLFFHPSMSEVDLPRPATSRCRASACPRRSTPRCTSASRSAAVC